MSIFGDFFEAVSFLTILKLKKKKKKKGIDKINIANGTAGLNKNDINTNAILPDSDSESNSEILKLKRSIKFFPLAGLLIGLLLCLIFYIFNRIVEPDAAVIISIAFLFIITGGLHFDGLSDTADGLTAFLKTADRKQFFKAMKDVRTGSSGVLALIFYVAIIWAVINGFASLYRYFALVSFPVIGRYSIVLMSYFSNTPDDFRGIGAIFTKDTTGFTLLIASIATFIIIFFLFRINGIMALFIVSFFVLILSYYFSKKFGGVTGDMLGFTCKISELAYLISLFGFYKI